MTSWTLEDTGEGNAVRRTTVKEGHARIRTGDPLLPKRVQQDANHGKKPPKSLVDCTICRTCREAVPESAGVQRRE